ncbi:hypothetical protein L228DRAFT_99956 [Xylona heveae TC161]|uniref:Uncharacterized protein n=1 Tax=Xylona heveae (strain CBS 132557 / TC161) TaxID=1328760 RepID=A0A165I9X3_XYLHT|nr:hypothetical protein L228DRAFT_99956 [Xylona heveae TC161]KZF24601.1 hypothetical protein L228DRAFT_99956 [Xylona heveae TC161]
MGRQAYITRLALGRSAYEAPEESEPAGSVPHAGQNSSIRPTNEIDAGNEGSDYVQLYDHRGHPTNPASKASARTLIKAQNDVLATVGVCVGVQGDGKLTSPSTKLEDLSGSERAKVKLVMEENEVGLWIRSVSSFLESTGMWPIMALKNRIQVLRPYSQVSFVELLKAQWRQTRALSFLFPGFVAQSASVVFGVASDILFIGSANLFPLLLAKHGISRRHPRASRYSILFVRTLAEIMPYLIIYPFEIFVALQILHLIPPWPLLPPLRSFIPFSSASPIQLPQLPSRINPKSIVRMIVSSVTSPFVMVWLYNSTFDALSAFLSEMILPRLIARSDPDEYSIKGSLESGIRVDGISGLSPSVQTGDADPGIFRTALNNVVDSVRGAFDPEHSQRSQRRAFEQSRDGIIFSDLHRLPNSRSEAELNSQLQEVHGNTQAADQISGDISARGSRETAEDDEEEDEEGGVGLNRADYVSTNEGQAPRTRSSSVSSSSVHSRPTNAVRVSSTRHGNSETVTMEVEIDTAGIINQGGGMRAADALQPQPVQQILEGGITASPVSASLNPLPTPLGPPGFDNQTPIGDQFSPPDGAQNSSRRRRHRSRRAAEAASNQRKRKRQHITILSNSPALTMANLIASIAAGCILSPFQATVNRSIARSFLAAASTPEQRANAAFFLPQIYTTTTWPFGLGAAIGSTLGLGHGRSLWKSKSSGDTGPSPTSLFGGSGPSLLAYSSKLLLCCGLEAAVGFTCWQISYLVSVAVGMARFGWEGGFTP